jgi:hypothetical protein
MQSISAATVIPESLSAASRALLGECIYGKEHALSFLEKPIVDGEKISRHDEDLVLHFAFKELVAQTLSAKPEEDQLMEENRLVQWESALGVVLYKVHGEVKKAASYQPLLKAFEGQVKTPEDIKVLEKALVDVAGGRALERSLVRGLLNQVEGRCVAASAEDLTEEALGSSARTGFKEFGRILASRIQVGRESGKLFLLGELGSGCGFDGYDRNAILHFAVLELAQRTLSSAAVEGPSGEGKESPSRSSLGKCAKWWDSLCGLLRETWKGPKGTFEAGLGAVCEALRKASVNDAHRETFSRVFKKVVPHEHQLLLTYMLTQASRDARGAEAQTAQGNLWQL